MRRVSWVACFIGLSALTGCGGGDSGTAVSGEVSYQGEPVADGMIQFVPTSDQDGRLAGAPIVDGRYSITRQGGPTPGVYRVEVSSFQEVRKQSEDEIGGALFGRDPSELGIAPESLTIRENVIPENFNTASTMTVTIPEQSRFTFDVEIP